MFLVYSFGHSQLYFVESMIREVMGIQVRRMFTHVIHIDIYCSGFLFGTLDVGFCFQELTCWQLRGPGRGSKTRHSLVYECLEQVAHKRIFSFKVSRQGYFERRLGAGGEM